jgi:anti-anti-sigma factor
MGGTSIRSDFIDNKLTFDKDGPVLHVKLEGRVHGAWADHVDHELTRAAKHADYIVIDMDKLEYIASGGLRTMLKLRRETVSRGGGVAFARPMLAVREVFEIASFQHLFPIVDTPAEALKHWGL